MIEARQNAAHATGAMVKREGNHTAIMFGIVHPVGRRGAVVQQVVMRQQHAFRRACGPGSVLNVDDFVRVRRIGGQRLSTINHIMWICSRIRR